MRKSTGWLLFVCWALAGCCLVLGFLTLLTVGMALLPISFAAIGALLWLRRSRNATALGLLVGAALPLIYVAWLNRAGPGTVCVATASTESCIDEWSPWPWLVAGLIIGAAGISVFAVLIRRSTSAPLPRQVVI